MTKKSAARQERDAIKKVQEKQQAGVALNETEQAVEELSKFYEVNTSWDDLNELYQKSAEQLAGSFDQLIQLYKTPGLLNFLEQEEYKETKIMFNGIMKDFEQLSEVLKAIHDRHKDYTGGAKTAEDFAFSIEIFEAYNNYTVRYDALITPIFNTIVERAGTALAKIDQAVRDEQERANAQDVNVVTDVEVK